MTSSGAPWGVEEKEQLRRAWLSLINQFPERSEAAMRAMLWKLAEYNHKNDWPYNSVRERTTGEHCKAPDHQWDLVGDGRLNWYQCGKCGAISD